MDPVAVFNALYDTKCIKFGRFNLKSGQVAPYYINLRRLPLYPKLMDAIVNQVVDKFLTSQALLSTTAELKKQISLKSAVKQALQMSIELDHNQKHLKYVQNMTPSESDVDSQLDDSEPTTPGEYTKDIDNTFTTPHIKPMISGVPYGAIPLAALIANKAQLPYLFERKNSKQWADHNSLLDDFEPEEQEEIDSITTTDQRSVILIEDVICSGESILQAVRNLEAKNLKVEFVICIVDRELNGVNLLLEQAGIHVLCLYNISATLRILEATNRITSEQFIETRKWIMENQIQSIQINHMPAKSSDSDTTPTKQDTTIPISVAAS